MSFAKRTPTLWGSVNSNWLIEQKGPNSFDLVSPDRRVIGQAASLVDAMRMVERREREAKP